MYPVEDIYFDVELTEEPDNDAIREGEMHDDGDKDDVQLSIVTTS